MKLTSRAATIFWTGSGAFVGLFLGVLVVDSPAAGDLAPAWGILFALFVGLVVWKGRGKKPSARSIRVEREPVDPARPERLHLDFQFPDVPLGFPPVAGVEEPLRVRVRVTTASKPAEGAAVRLTGHPRDGARFVAGEGVTGSDGSVDFALKRAAVGELVLEAEASLEASEGRGEASVSLVRYDEEIARLFTEFRSYAHEALGPDSRADTARELAEKLRDGADQQTSRALLELARVYELVAYGERDADRRLYLALVGALLTLERSGEVAAAPVEG